MLFRRTLKRPPIFLKPKTQGTGHSQRKRLQKRRHTIGGGGVGGGRGGRGGGVGGGGGGGEGMCLKKRLDQVSREWLKEQFLREIAEDYAEEVGGREETGWGLGEGERGGGKVRNDEKLDASREEAEGAGYTSPVSPQMVCSQHMCVIVCMYTHVHVCASLFQHMLDNLQTLKLDLISSSPSHR